MKRISLFITILCFCVQFAQAQENFKQSLSGIKLIKIETNTDVKITSGNGNELVLSKYKAKNNDDDHEYEDEHEDDYKKKKEDKKKGMKAIYAGGTDNTGFGMSITKEGEVLRVRDLKSFMQRSGLSFTIPKHINVHVNCGNLGSVNAEGLSSEIEIDSNVGAVVLNNVTGPVTASTSTGNIDVIFTNVNQSNPISISTSTGNIDVSLPTGTKTNLELSSTMGNVYTDFDIKIPTKKGLSPMGYRQIETKLNGGGVKISLRSSTGDIFLRKANN